MLWTSNSTTIPARRTTRPESVAQGIYVQYGCGFSSPPEWNNFDASPTLRWEKIPLLGRLVTKNERRFPSNVQIGDIVKGLPIPPARCAGIYASHVLEHLTLSEFHAALRNTKQLLQPGGIFRLVVPDLEWAAREYIRRLDAGESSAHGFFLEETSLGTKDRLRGLRNIVQQSFSASSHCWMWDSLSLYRALEMHGYIDIRPCSFGDCEDPMFGLVEDIRRFEHATAMEARVG